MCLSMCVCVRARACMRACEVVSVSLCVCVRARACMRACEVVESGMNGLIEAEDVVLQLRFRLHLLREYIL